MKPIVKSLIYVLLLTEIAVRVSGAVSFPTYDVDDAIGYIPKANQQGKFLQRYEWVFNDRSMGTAASWNPNTRSNLLLIGNSIVMGGNPYDQKDKLGPLLQQDLGDRYSVWPIAAGGWTNANEVVYLKRNPDVVRHANLFLWEFMAGGFSGLSHWNGDYIWPRERPVWATWYVFRRYIVPRLLPVNSNELPPTGKPDSQQRLAFAYSLTELSRATGEKRPGLIFLYPDKSQYLAARQGKEWLPERNDVERIARANGVIVVDVAGQPEWSAALYRPDGVHPTAQGNAVLAGILNSAMKESGILR